MSIVDTQQPIATRQPVECRYCGEWILQGPNDGLMETWAEVRPVRDPEYCPSAPYAVHRPDRPEPTV